MKQVRLHKGCEPRDIGTVGAAARPMKRPQHQYPHDPWNSQVLTRVRLGDGVDGVQMREDGHYHGIGR
jgi:hypothetical protein